MFENLTVTENFKNSIEKAVRDSRLSHALILEGADESTRAEAARETAGAILCSREAKPCLSCSACMKVAAGAHPDLYITKKPADSKFITVDTVRDIRKKALVFPNEGAKSVFIICEAQFMNPQAQNALLKIFEEPSPHVAFILTCDSKSSLLETIISRATCYCIGEAASGSQEDPRTAKIKDFTSELLDCFIRENELSFLKKTAVFAKDKALFKEVLRCTLSVIRDTLIIQSSGKELLSGLDAQARSLAAMLPQKKTMLLYEGLKKLSEDVDGFANHNLSITRFSALLYRIKTS